MQNGERYLEPVTANLILYADGFAAGTCEWSIDDTVIDNLPCDKAAVAHNLRYDGSHTITARPSTGAPITINAALKDILFVSFGDSFSSGEDNPEKPARMYRDSFNSYQNSSRGQAFPVREDLNIVADNPDHFFKT